MRQPTQLRKALRRSESATWSRPTSLNTTMGWCGVTRTSPPSCMGLSDRGDSHCLGTLGSLLDLKFDALVLFQRPESAAADLGVVDEHIGRAAVRSDEAEALFAVEPFHSSLCHLPYFSHSERMYQKHPRRIVARLETNRNFLAPLVFGRAPSAGAESLPSRG